MNPVPHVLTVWLEEHFQLRPPGRRVPERHWDRFPSRLSRNADAALALFDRAKARATFFAGGWVASRHPEVLRRIAEAGQEVACLPDPPSSRLAGEAVEGAAAARAQVEAAAGRAVAGCRISAPGDWDGCRLALRDAGFLYECSLSRGSFGESPPAVPGGLMRLPVPARGFAGTAWAVSGGAALRMLPEGVAVRWLADRLGREGGTVFDFRLWELDPDTPRLSVLSPAQALACYRNLDRFGDRLASLLDAGRFVPARAHFGLADEAASATGVAVPQVAPRRPAPERPDLSARPRDPLTIVIPCFNEEAGLAYLANALDGLDRGLGRRYRLSYVLVDDGSTDGTWAGMDRLFGADPRFRLIRHVRNRGIGAAVLTGIAAAPDEVVAVMDSDCSYDPARLEDMVPLLGADVALVTASPYHADGGVEGVPEWRLVLSRGASRLYRVVLRNKLATYTSCFRVCRKSALAGLKLRHEGYIGVVEMLARLDLAGWRIVEHPVLLETRFFGRSKLKILRAIAGHLRFLGEISLAQINGRRRLVRVSRLKSE
ncbi:MAG: glycosyltransferase [Paracoccaceae bacterium]